jgi:mRNA-degrading endonuclease YafQ of YafQ-DinJ toxin-antitoxin module
MRAEYHKSFDKMYARLPDKKKTAVRAAIKDYLTGQNTDVLRIHSLRGEWAGHTSISAGGDLRLHFIVYVEADTAFFVAVGSHSQLYK